MPVSDPVTITHEEWLAEGRRRFGEVYADWKFVCPICAHVASVGDFEQYADKGSTPSSATCECIGRYTGAKEFKPKGQGPCNYAGYGLFRLNPVHVIGLNPDKPVHSFAFAEPDAQ